MTFLLILAVGIFLRFYNLGEPSLWVDEAFSFWVANGNLASVIEKITFDAHPPLYFILLHFWIYLGQTEFILRSLSVIFGLGTLVLIYFFAKDCLRNKKLGLLASFLYAVSSFSIVHIDTDAKMYSLLTFLSLLSLYLLIKALQTSKSYFWWLYGFATLLSLYTHYYSFFVFFAQILYLAWLYFIKKHKNIQLKWAVLLLLYVLWLNVFVYQSIAKDKGELLPAPSFSNLYYTFYCFNGLDLLKIPKYIEFLVLLIFAFFLIKGVIVFLRKNDFSKGLLFQFITVLFIPFLISCITPKHIYWTRYQSVILPLYLLLVAFGINSLKKEKVKFFTLILFIAINLLSFNRYYSSIYYQKQNWRSTVNFIEETSRTGDGICFQMFYNIFAFNYYYKDKTFKIQTAPEGEGYILVADKEYLQKGGLYQYGLDKIDVRILKEIFKNHYRVWVVLNEENLVDPEGEVLRWFNRYYNFRGGVETKAFRGKPSIIKVYLFTKK